MPAALVRVEGASRLLEEASAMLKADPYSGPARYIFYLKQMDWIIKHFVLQGSPDIPDILSNTDLILLLNCWNLTFIERSLLKAPEAFCKEHLLCCFVLMSRKYGRLFENASGCWTIWQLQKWLKQWRILFSFLRTSVLASVKWVHVKVINSVI